MKIFADLNALERHLEFFAKEEKTVSTLIRLVEEQQKTNLELSVELEQFLREQLYFLQKEKKEIRLRCWFIQSMLNDLRYANNTLEEALDSASNILVSSDGY